MTAVQFGANLDYNLGFIAKSLKSGSYGFSKLRPVFIPKANSNRDRLICVPTVKDRIVQRVIVEYLTSKSKLPIYNSSSFGFIQGKGTREAIAKAIELRSCYGWCLKTDIEAFFDRIPRAYLKSRVNAALGIHSLTPLVCSAIDCEVKETSFSRSRLIKQGIKKGVGIRQGMPLSPLLANLVLSEFDAAIERRGISMVRYADDLLFFFSSKDEARKGQTVVKELLSKLELSIPDIGECSKTEIVAPEQPIEFLGREIVFVGSANEYVARISLFQIQKIKSRLEDDYSYEELIKSGSNLQDAIADFRKSISAYLGIYQDAWNFLKLDAELRGVTRTVISNLFTDLFGRNALQKLNDDGRRFLGIGHLDMPDPCDDLGT